MRPQQTREKNPYNRPLRDRRTGAEWGNRQGDELGYQRTYGEYGSDARGWVDERHQSNWSHHERPERDYAGVPPKKYRRSDATILDHVAEVLTWSPDVDATDITIAVKEGDVILSGTVPERDMIYIIDELMEEVHGVKNFDNHVKKAKI